MSVDTYLKGKNTSGYQRLVRDDVEILLSPRLVSWAEAVDVGLRDWKVRKYIRVHVRHRHTDACRH